MLREPGSQFLCNGTGTGIKVWYVSNKFRYGEAKVDGTKPAQIESQLSKYASLKRVRVRAAMGCRMDIRSNARTQGSVGNMSEQSAQRNATQQRQGKGLAASCGTYSAAYKTGSGRAFKAAQAQG